MRALGVSQYSIHILAVFLLCLALTIPTLIATVSGDEIDRLALLAFKSKITHDPQGAFRSWNNSLHFCNWEGIICSNRHRRVTTLDLRSKGLAGSLSPGIGNLSFLQEIILSNNTLQGIIPQELGQLFRLKVLILKYNNLEGEIPKNISNCSNLIQLSVANNKLTGKPPIELASLSKLQELVLDFNNFTGEIPPFIGNLTSLQVLSASQNAFTGYVSVDFGSLLHLKKLRLPSNNLGSGEQGDLSFLGSLANCSSLRTLELGANNFGGSLPQSISNLSTELTWINLAGNQISGSIPSEICKFINLIFLDFGANKFTGIIPSEIVKLGKLQRVVLSNNRLLGKIPASIGNLSMLDQLHFDNNKLEGTIPPSFGNCQMLVLLDLSQNNLTGTIPNKLFDALAFSIMLNLSRNHLVGPLPADVGRLKTLGKFDVSENQLSGEIPRGIGGCAGLEKLYIQGNFIQGPIPDSMKELKGMQNFDLSRNNFSGEIPDFLETLSLKYLNLSWNDFDGEVPVIGVYANLSAFSVEGNKRLCGGIANLQLPRCSIEGSHKRKISRAQAIIFIASFLLTCTMVSSSYFFCQRKKKPYSRSISMVSRLNFTRRRLPLVSFFKVSYDDLYAATNGFSSTNLVSEGGSGSVYKGIFGTGYNGILDGDEVVAVKVLKPQFGGASNRVMAKIEAFRGTRHTNLVKIITTCSSVDPWGQDFRAIVYEFMQRGSLESWLHSTQAAYQDGLNKPHILDVHARINIAIDVACALDYLHHQYGNPIIHCNLEPSNILLGSDMAARVLAKFLPESPNFVRSSSVGLQGSIGYVPPEYGLGNKVSTKGDVYSYGILLLEMLTGKKPTDPMFHGDLNLHNFVSNVLPDRVMDIIDPVILPLPEFSEVDGYKLKGLIIMFNIGVKCTMESPRVRPHIRDVLGVLETVRTMFKKKGFVEPYLNDSFQAAALMAKKPMKFIPHRSPYSRPMLMLSSFEVSYEDLHKATNGFSWTNLVGKGGFGSVYKGIFHQASARFHLQYSGIGDGDGTVIAVKVFNLQRKGALTSFTTECTILRNISYKNLVKIITTCTSVDKEGHDFRAILYEFMEHGSLARWLHSARKKKTHHDGLNKPRMLNLHTRINIAIDVACAVNYLHHQCEKPIIHCDLKSSNILLDRDMIARVADFGLATFLPKSPNSYQSSSIGSRGTTGYIPPEYGLGSMMSTKGDVYSFGILLLEMLTGKKPTHRMFHGGINLHTFAWMALPDRIMDITDPVMKRMASSDEDHGNQMRECLTKMFNIGVKCSKPSPQVRPDIRDVLHELKSLKDIFKEIELQPTSPFRD